MGTINPANSNAITMAFRKFEDVTPFETDPIKNAIDTKLARIQVQINAAAIRSADEALGTILDLIA